MQLNNKRLPPVHRHQFREWLNDPVTEHLFRDLENMYFDCVIDALPTQSIEQIAIESIKRESCRQIVDIVLEWTPTGASDEDDD